MVYKYPPDSEHALKALPDWQKDSFFRSFIAGSLCLDFLNGFRSCDQVDWKNDFGNPLGKWLVSADLAPYPPPEPTSVEIAEAQQLMGAINRLTSAFMTETNYLESDLDSLNSWAKKPLVLPQLSAGGFDWIQCNFADSLAVVARDAVELLGRSKHGQIRKCADEKCGEIFFDPAPPNNPRRRWCRMWSCGNRAKVNEFNKRKKAQAEPGPT